MAFRKTIKSESDSDDDVQITAVYPDFENLPELALLNIFDYLNSRDLRRVASVCKKWNKLAVQSSNWRRFDTRGLDLDHSNILHVLRKIPFNITHIRIMLEHAYTRAEVNLSELSEIIYQRCKKLEELYFEDCSLTEFEVWNKWRVFPERLMLRPQVANSIQSSYSHPLIFLPHSLRLLSFRRVRLSTPSLLLRVASQEILPNLEVLELSTWLFDEVGHGPPSICDFNKLKELHLSLALINRHLHSYVHCFTNLKILNFEDAVFERSDLSKLHGYVGNLEELYLCNVHLQEEHLKFVNEHTFPNLKLICLKSSEMSKEFAEGLFHFCRTLKTVVSNVTDECGKLIFGYYECSKRNISFYLVTDCSEVHCKEKYHINPKRKHHQCKIHHDSSPRFHLNKTKADIKI